MWVELHQSQARVRCARICDARNVVRNVQTKHVVLVVEREGHLSDGSRAYYVKPPAAAPSICQACQHEAGVPREF